MLKSDRSLAAASALIIVACAFFSGCGKAAQTRANDSFAQGRAAQNRGDYKTAVADYNEAAKSLPPDPRLSYDRGVSEYNLKQYPQADADLSEALRLVQAGNHTLGASFVRAISYFRGLSRIQEAKWAGAKDDLRQAVVFYPKSWLAWDSLGYARAALGDYRNAIPDYNHGLHTYPKDAIDHNNRALAYYHLGQQRAAVADFNAAIHLAPRWGTLYQNRGQAYFAARDYRDADRDFTRAIALIPKAWSWGYRCEARENLGEVKAALSDCTRALAYYPTWTALYIDRAWAEAALGANKRALADADRAVKLDPHYALAFTYRGWIRQRMMQYRAAFIDYDEALRLNPHDAVANQDRAGLGSFVVAAQRAGVTSYGIGTLNVAQMENEQEPTKTEYEQRVSECGGYYSESDSYFDDCVQNGVDQAKDDESKDQEAADQAESDAYNAQQQIQEQINYQQQEEDDAAAQAQEEQNYAQSESDNSSGGYYDSSGSDESSSEGESEPAPVEEAPVEEAPPEEESGGGG
jgi:tetratricopeptide (TPR) repeat protein